MDGGRHTNRWHHPTLTLRVPSSLSKAWALASARDVIDCYFNLLEETLLENKLKDFLRQIFNMDESGMPLDPELMKTTHGDPNPVTTTTGNKAQITVVACISTPGNYIPPMIIDIERDHFCSVWQVCTLYTELL